MVGFQTFDKDHTGLLENILTEKIFLAFEEDF